VAAVDANPRVKLSKTLRPIYDLELSLGNEVGWVEEPAGTRCPYAVIFKRPLHLAEIRLAVPLDRLACWENHDPHYPIHAGILCELTRHCVEGPQIEGMGKRLKRWFGFAT
jgi:hypothetical protein